MSLTTAGVLIRGLAAAGLRDAVVCPGSRSAALAVAASRCPKLRVHPVIDERAAGFFALGLARASGRPAAVICTSGSAGAHLYPAVIEAAAAAVPMVAITADRPPELQQCAAPQTVDQRGLFGRFVRAELALDTGAGPAELRGVARVAVQAVATSLGPLPGPVHINAPARKPLCDGDLSVEIAGPRIEPPRLGCSAAALEDLTARVERAERPLLCAGPAPLAARRWRPALFEAAAVQSMPLLAEATSQLRFCPRPGAVPAISWFADRLLAPLSPPLRPDLVISVGVPSGAGLLRLGADPAIEHVVLAPYQIADPAGRAAAVITGDIAESAAAIAAAGLQDPAGRRRFARAWLESDRAPETGDRFGGQTAIAAALSALPAGSAVVAGNSLSVRWLDQAIGAGAGELDVISQRGASGIDGLIAGAAGVAAAGDRPVCLLCGDVSAAHDVGGLALAAAGRAPLVLVVLDNGGGKIFDELPYARALSASERELFVTPPAVSLERAAAAWDLPAIAVGDPGALETAVAEASGRAGATLIRAQLQQARPAIGGP